MKRELQPPDCGEPATKPGELLFFLFAGQSNMAGADALIAGDGSHDLLEAGLQTEADRTAPFTYGPVISDDLESGFCPWGDIRGHGSPALKVHGPEVGFARTLHEAGIHNIAIIKVAANIPYDSPGRDTWPWGKGEKTDAPDYYDQWHRFVHRRTAEMTQRGYSGKVEGVVWHQGIDDAINRVTEEAYAERLSRLIADLRQEYNCPAAPLLLARSANSPIATVAAMAPIRAAQQRVADGDDRALWIDVDDLPNVNQHHFSSSAQLVIGRRFGEAYLKLR